MNLFFPYPETFAVVVGTPLVIDMRNKRTPVTITAIPGAGGSVLIEISTSPGAVEGTGTPVWIEWPVGDATIVEQDVLLGPVSAIRATATIANARVEVVR